MASFNSPDSSSILDNNTSLPAVLNHETPVILNITIEHNYTLLMEYLLIQLLFMLQSVVRIMKVRIIFKYIILPMLECTIKK